MKRLIIRGLALSLLCSVSLPVLAAVSAQEAAQLKTTLTPTGAERAGNADGTIPAWTGGLTTVPPGVAYDPSSGKQPNWFPNEKPILTITAANAAQYQDKLSIGTLYLLQHYDGYKIEIYPTHRTFAGPQTYYDGTFANATSATLEPPDHVTGAARGIPYPIPKNGYEAMTNASLFLAPTDSQFSDSTYYTSRDGAPTLVSTDQVSVTQPYYYPPDRTPPTKDAYNVMTRVLLTAPAYNAGIQFLVYNPVDWSNTASHSWTYLAGQRRVRKLPNSFYDNPSPSDSGITTSDETHVFNGALDKYTWKILGKKEMYVPYNDEALNADKDTSKILGPKFVNPDDVRWELHRVWAVEGDLVPGQRHVVPKRIVYLDEDSWIPVLGDEWDAQGNFWKAEQGLIYSAPHMPTMFPETAIYYDTVLGGYVVFGLQNTPDTFYKFSNGPMVPVSTFSPQNMAQTGVD